MYISGELRCCYGFLDLLYNRLSFKRSFLTYGVVATKNKQKMGFKIRNFLWYLRIPTKKSIEIKAYFFKDWICWHFLSKNPDQFFIFVFKMEFLWGNFSKKFDPSPIMFLFTKLFRHFPYNLYLRRHFLHFD